MEKKRNIVAAVIFLLTLHLAILFAGFVAPYDAAAQNRDFPFAPPTRIHLVDARGHMHIRPFIYAWVARPDGIYEYEESHQREYPLHFLVRGSRYQIAGLFRSDVHLFGVDGGSQVFVAGTDNYGRDQFSRIRRP